MNNLHCGVGFQALKRVNVIDRVLRIRKLARPHSAGLCRISRKAHRPGNGGPVSAKPGEATAKMPRSGIVSDVLPSRQSVTIIPRLDSPGPQQRHRESVRYADQGPSSPSRWNCSPCSRADEFGHRIQSQSRLEQKTLSHVTPMFAEETSLALPFHAFRHDPQSESVRHGNHCLHDRCVVWVRVTLPDKALVDLDRVYRIAFSRRTTRNTPSRNRQSLFLIRSPAVQ